MATDRELVVRTLDLLNAAKGSSRLDAVTLPTDDAIARGPSPVPAEVGLAADALRDALATEAATLAAAKSIRGILGTVAKAIL